MGPMHLGRHGLLGQYQSNPLCGIFVFKLPSLKSVLCQKRIWRAVAFRTVVGNNDMEKRFEIGNRDAGVLEVFPEGQSFWALTG